MRCVQLPSQNRISREYLGSRHTPISKKTGREQSRPALTGPVLDQFPSEIGLEKDVEYKLAKLPLDAKHP
jgi:hypothetical protein